MWGKCFVCLGKRLFRCQVLFLIRSCQARVDEEKRRSIFLAVDGRALLSFYICYSLIFCWKRLKRPGKVHKKVPRTKISSSFSPLHKTWARKDHPSPLCLQRGNCCSCNFYRGRTRNWREFSFDQRWGNDDKVGRADITSESRP